MHSKGYKVLYNSLKERHKDWNKKRLKYVTDILYTCYKNKGEKKL